METALFNRFEIDMPLEAVYDCSHQGECDDDVEHWSSKIARPERCTVEPLRAELKEYGAWDEDELADDDTNWQRIIWIAAGNIKENIREMENA